MLIFKEFILLLWEESRTVASLQQKQAECRKYGYENKISKLYFKWPIAVQVKMTDLYTYKFLDRL